MGSDCVIIDFNEAKRARDKFKAIESFLGCNLTNESVRSFVRTLINNNMLYYFDEDAFDAIDQQDNPIFTTKQAACLNIIIDRFKQKLELYNKLFHEVETNYDFYTKAQ